MQMSDSDCAEVSTSHTTSTPKKDERDEVANFQKKKNHYKQLFRPEWMENDDYRMWLKPTDDKSRAYCSLCKKDFVAELTVIKNHASGKKTLSL